MARLARVVVPGLPHHVTQRGNGRQQTFFGDSDDALYRDLGIKKATRGMAVAHVIRLLGKCDPQVVSKWHYHAADFQMIYVLKGTVTTEMEGHGAHTLKAGDAWLQPPSVVHRVLDYSDGCELLEIVLPGDFKTVELEK